MPFYICTTTANVTRGCSSLSLQNTMLTTLKLCTLVRMSMKVCFTCLYLQLRIVPKTACAEQNHSFAFFYFCWRLLFCLSCYIRSHSLCCVFSLFLLQVIYQPRTDVLGCLVSFVELTLFFFLCVVLKWHTAMECLRIMFCHTFYCFSYILSFMLHLKVTRFMVCACLLYRLLSRNKKNVSYFYTCNVAYDLLNLKTRKHDNIDTSPMQHIDGTHGYLIRA